LNETDPQFQRGYQYEKMVRVAIHSAKVNAPTLSPILIYNGKQNKFTESIEQLGAQIIYHRLSFQDAVESVTTRNPEWTQTAKGAFLRLDIPNILKDFNETILYTDVDVIFLDDPSKYSLETTLFAFSSEFIYDNFKDINTGVMLLNLSTAKEVFPEFINWTIKNLEWIPDYDQGAIRAYFNGNWDRLSQRMNWKPYWGNATDPIIVHFHGPKPLDFDPLTLLPNFNYESNPSYSRLHALNMQAYRSYLKQYITLSHTLYDKFDVI